MGNRNSTSDPKLGNKDSFVIGSINSIFGNQLFQIANAYAYAKCYNKKIYLTKFWKGRNAKNPNYWDTYLTNPQLHSYLISDNKKVDKVYREPYFKYKKIDPYNNNIRLEGFYQSEKYFIDYQDEIRQLFKPNERLNEMAETEINKIKGSSDIPLVMVHIRKDDYASSKKHIVQPLNYYLESQSKIETHLGIRPIYVYFTDDPMWVKINFSLKEKDTIISSKSFKDYEEFSIMQKCDHFIIANSTFSWWAAWLSDKNIDKKVYVPINWFGFGYNGRDSWKDIYSESQKWEIIGNINSSNILEKFFLGVITCEKYKHKIIEQNFMNMNLPFKFKYFVGNPSLTEAVEDKLNNIVYLPCPDNYESLSRKVYCMLDWIIKTHPDILYIAKLEDDVKINKESFLIYIKEIAKAKYEYCGVKTNIKKEKVTKRHFGKTEDPELTNKEIILPKTRYCEGSAYFLSRKSVNIILEDFWKPETGTTIYEDQSIGHCLNLRGIEPIHITLKNNACFWK